MLLEIFKDAFEYSYKDTDSIFKLGILSLLSMIFVFPIFLVAGYYYRVTKVGVNGTINGDDPLPKFENWFEMFIQGFKILFVRFIYLLPAILIFIIVSAILWVPFGIQVAAISPSPMDSSFNSLIFSLVIFQFGVLSVSAILCIILYLFSTVAVANMVNNNSLTAAFNFKEIINIIESIGFIRYIKFYLGSIVLGIGIFGAALLAISLIISSMSFVTYLITNSGIYAGVIAGPIGGILSIVVILSLIPFFITFESRAIALIYNMRELD